MNDQDDTAAAPIPLEIVTLPPDTRAIIISPREGEILPPDLQHLSEYIQGKLGVKTVVLSLPCNVQVVRKDD